MAFDDPLASLTQQTHLLWRLDRPMRYRGNHDVWEVPEGFITDLASVPRMAAWLIPRYGVYTPAAILHDYLWELTRRGDPSVTKADADGLFRRCLRELGVSGPKRWMMWAAVRAASFMSGAKAIDWVWFLLILLPSLAFIVIPAVVVQVWLVVFWVVELSWWAAVRAWHGKRGVPETPTFPKSI